MSNQAADEARAVVTAILNQETDSTAATKPLLEFLVELQSAGKLDREQFENLSSQVERLREVIAETVNLADRAVTKLRDMGYDVSQLEHVSRSDSG